jgi:hypothetical protein
VAARSESAVELIRRLALPIAVISLLANVVMLVGSAVLWLVAIQENWIDDVRFVSHVSMLALVFAAIGGVAGGLAGLMALMPTDDLFNGDR